MSQVEGGPIRIDPRRQTARKVVRAALKPFFPETVVPSEHSGLNEAMDHLRNGGSIILYSRHRNRVDPLAGVFALYDQDPEFVKELPIAHPIGDHQKKLAGIPLVKAAEKVGLSLNPVMTKSSHDKYKKKIWKGGGFLRRLQPFPIPHGLKPGMIEEIPKENTGFAGFAKAAAYALENNGVVYVPTQSERAGLLNDVVKGERTLGRMGMLVQEQQIPNVGILVVDVTTAKGDANPPKKGGLDLFRTNHVTFGGFTLFEDAVKAAGGATKLDAWGIRTQMTKTASPSHWSPELTAKMKDAT